ncbi:MULTISPECIES: peptide chain release factor N(5)-glutamine methyltransferase [Pacificibacter]|uniref:peptide chain release factor N(5)-glutamine methyltransferase n=1 Tax=Pacificibacter TaxID=1042323 RepID=UPI001C0932E7|nr:peptide chain release factor N(5)-glutamine methyltransferase [Pacificibacter sp. 1_MG-2023]MBU2936936.1 peptide chain release factor N(5)-glutamine methyltransferase [Pacificibacter marinus]MDO6614930.1 peptide chain release factor N(5)-glutamine methyltransferase [Pacificibacter sp. 1_MG-2023]
MTVQQALVLAARRLTEAGLDGAARDARLLMAHVLQIDASRITLVAPEALDTGAQTAFDTCITRRCAREPVSHILGRRSFYGHDFTVTPDVLDPRPETEVLIAEALKKPFSSVLDLGVGSGAIVLSLLAEQPLAKGQGSDLSAKALAVAQSNADQLGLSSRVRFSQSDWFENITGLFDLIVSNPPYIALDEMPDLSPELSFEPRMALTDEADGLQAYRIITAGALAHLRPRGRILLEIGPTQGSAVADMLLAQGFKAVRIVPDLDGRDRIVCAVAPHSNSIL